MRTRPTTATRALVLMGVKMMKVPDEPYVRQAGVLPDRERMVAYEAADVTIAPGSDDPLALSVLESFAVGTPVLACARNAAAVEHCRRAGAGLYYATREEFVEATAHADVATAAARAARRKRAPVRPSSTTAGTRCLGRFERLVTMVRGRG